MVNHDTQIPGFELFMVKPPSSLAKISSHGHLELSQLLGPRRLMIKRCTALLILNDFRIVQCISPGNDGKSLDDPNLFQMFLDDVGINK